MLPTLLSLAPTRVLLFSVTRGNRMRQYSAQKQEKLIWSESGEARARTPGHTLLARPGLPYRVSSAGGEANFCGTGCSCAAALLPLQVQSACPYTAVSAILSHAVTISVHGRCRHLESWGPLQLCFRRPS